MKGARYEISGLKQITVPIGDLQAYTWIFFQASSFWLQETAVWSHTAPNFC